MPYIYKSGLQFGTNNIIDTFVGTDGTVDGTAGLVPAPDTSETNMFLKSDGTWDVPAGGGGGSVVATDVPTANTISKFDENAHMNSEDMTAEEISDFVDNFEEQQVTVADYIVSQGVDGDWTYRKWNSGVAECWGAQTLSTTISNAWGNGYESGAKTVQYPSNLFVTEPTVQLTNTGNWETIPVGYNQTKDTLSYELFRPSQLTSAQTFHVNIHAIGRWK